MINLMQGDCLERMKEIPDGSIDMVLTDPPYGMTLKPQRKNAKFYGKKIENDNNLDWVDSFFDLIYAKLKKQSVAFVFCNHFCIAEFIISAKASGFEVKNHLVWNKRQFGMGNNWRPVHESILVLTKGKFKTKSNSLRTIIEFKKVHHSKAVHPTEKPVDLIEHLIFETDIKADVILDPFMGSGSTGVAAKNLNRKFIGIELDENYFNIAKERINK
jgi:site-specific DNA-methyltransferase (adenine-specific)|tara:strand:+ start:231 stop:878 length:648 start_codon:yes stop_codon:yes gene_type:complete